jgi:hypothetical protein
MCLEWLHYHFGNVSKKCVIIVLNEMREMFVIGL